MAQTYKEMLQSPLWQKKRLEVFNQKGFRCEECGDEESQLAVHHKYYKKDFKPWDYQDDAYMVLCTPCHDAVHKAKKIVLTPKEAELIEAVRGNLNAKAMRGLVSAVENYEEDRHEFLTIHLLNIFNNTLLLSLINRHLYLEMESWNIVSNKELKSNIK